MASATSNTAAALPQNLARPNFGKTKEVTWETVKPDAIELYERMALADMIIRIDMMWGFKRSIAQWKAKIKEWGYIKNIPRKARECAAGMRRKGELEESRDSEFFPKDNQVTGEKSENSKRRKTGESSYVVGIPTYSHGLTPPPTIKAPSLEVTLQNRGSEEEEGEGELYKRSIPSSPLSEVSDFSAAQISSYGLTDCADKTLLATDPHTNELDPFEVLKQYLCENQQPWFACRSLDKHINHLEQLKRQISLDAAKSLKFDSSPDFPSLDGFNSSIGDCKQKTTIEGRDLADLLRGFGDLFILQNECEEYPGQAIEELEYLLATELQDCNQLEDAEYHLRKIFNFYHYRPMVKLRLGLILADTNRLEESTYMLFSGLSAFIVNFHLDTPENNTVTFQTVEMLFNEIISKKELGWTPLISYMNEMPAIIEKAASAEARNQIFPQFLIHGYAFAHECSMIGLVDSAKHMYKFLLQNSSHLDDTVHGIENAIAHREYSHLLRIGQDWATSAKQLVMAFDSMFSITTRELWHFDVLKQECDELLPQLVKTEEEISLRDKLKKMMTQSLVQDSSHMQDNLQVDKNLNTREIEENLSERFARLQTADLANLGMPSTASKLGYRDRDKVYTESLSWTSISSGKIGVTYTASLGTGMSELGFLG